MTGHVARAEVVVDAQPAEVWAALTDPASIKTFMFGADVETDWVPGSPITWSGQYEGTPYQDRGEILEVEPPRRLVMTHYSPLSGQPDVPESYHTLTYGLEPAGTGTRLSLSQDGNGSAEEAEHARGMWETMLGGIKAVVEAGSD